jgi:mono/diheme cytochrome c family protein
VNRLRTGCGRPGQYTKRCWTLLVLVAVLMAGCDLPGRPKVGDRPVPENQILSFEHLYKTNCAGCHGANGQVGPAPPLNDPIFLAIAPDRELMRVIREGRTNTPMPAFAQEEGGPLTDAQMKVLAEGIKKHWGPAQPPKAELPDYSAARHQESEGGAGEQSRGAKVFARACAMCHGEQGEGGEEGDRAIGAINDPAFLALISDQALRRYAITGRPDLGMPNFAQKDGRPPDFQPLSSREISDLVELLSSWRQAVPTSDH